MHQEGGRGFTIAKDCVDASIQGFAKIIKRATKKKEDLLQEL